MPEQLALARYQFPERQADRYLVHTLGQARYFFNQRDGVDSCSLVETGNPTFDSFFMNTSALPESVPYDLLVDQPLAGSSQTTARLKTIEEVKAFYRRLADFSHRRGHRLIVKLHPSNYDDRPLSDHANIEFLCDHPHPADLIRQSRAVFGFYSTLLLPAILWKPTCLFRVGQGNSLYETAEKMGVATVVDFDELPALDFDDRQRDPTALQQFEEMFLYRADGKASERLVDAVSTLCEMSANRQLAFRP